MCKKYPKAVVNQDHSGSVKKRSPSVSALEKATKLGRATCKIHRYQPSKYAVMKKILFGFILFYQIYKILKFKIIKFVLFYKI